MPGPVVPLPPQIPAFPDLGLGVWGVVPRGGDLLGSLVLCNYRLPIARVKVSGTQGARQLVLGQDNYRWFKAGSAESRIAKSLP